MHRYPFVLALLLVAACSDSTAPRDPVYAGAVVLNGVGNTGLTLVPDTGQDTDFVPLPASAFDGTVFAMRNDTVLTTASAWAGDLLYVVELESGDIETVQLPAGSSPAGATFLPVSIGVGAKAYAVALRDLGEVALVALLADGVDVTLVNDVGECPTDLVFAEGRIWVVDANQDCGDTWATFGPSRLIGFVPGAEARDTVELPGLLAAQRVFIDGHHAHVMASGDYLATAGAVARVDLFAGTVEETLNLPDDHYGTSMRMGEDGRLYVTASAADPFAPVVFVIELETMTFESPVAGLVHFPLTKPGGVEAQCYAATADEDGHIYCVENGAVVSTVLVFGRDGALRRSVAAGSPAFDIALR